MNHQVHSECINMECPLCKRDAKMLFVYTCNDEHGYCADCLRSLRHNENHDDRCPICHSGNVELSHMLFSGGNILRHGPITIKSGAGEFTITLIATCASRHHSDRVIARLSESIDILWDNGSITTTRFCGLGAEGIVYYAGTDENNKSNSSRHVHSPSWVAGINN